MLTLTVTQFLWFFLPAVIELVSGHEIPQTRYSSGLLAVLHSTQYLWITSYYQKKEARAAGDSQWSFSRYLVTLIAGGIALFIPGPWIVSRIFHADFAASFLTFTALVNIHHFILDGAIWKLRDSRIASLLLDGQQKSPGAGGEKQSRLCGGGSLVHGTSGSCSRHSHRGRRTVIPLGRRGPAALLVVQRSERFARASARRGVES